MNPSRTLWKIRRRFRRYSLTRRVVSFGGVASTSLVVHLEDGDRDRIWYHQQSKHCPHPDLLPEVRKGRHVRVCYLYGDPILSVISVFRRGLQRRLEKTMTPGRRFGRAALKHTTTLEEYVAEGRDRFRFEDHMDNWLGYQGDRASILAVKHEALGDHIQDVLGFLECSRPFEVRRRSSTLENQPEAIRKGLLGIYGELKERIDALPSITRINAPE